MTVLKDVILEAVREAWKERLQASSSSSSSDAKASAKNTMIADWKRQTFAQVASTYGAYYKTQNSDDIVAVFQQDIENCIDETIQDWKDAPPQVIANATNTTTTSFSLFTALGSGGGGLAAFFSWPSLVEKSNEDEIWQGLTRVEYLEDVWPDWTAAIRPWIQARLLLSNGNSCILCRKWYGKARQQASLETNAIVLDLMQDVFNAILGDPTNESSSSAASPRTPCDLVNARKTLLSVGVDMVTDHLIRQGIASLPPTVSLTALWKASFRGNDALVDTLASKDPGGRWLHLFLQTHPFLYRQVGSHLDMMLLAHYLQRRQDETLNSDHQQQQERRHLYTLALVANLLILVRVAGFPWETIHKNQSEAKNLVYQMLWELVRISTTPNRDLYIRGLEALLSGSSGSQDQVREMFQKDWSTIQKEHTSPELLPLFRFATE